MKSRSSAAVRRSSFRHKVAAAVATSIATTVVSFAIVAPRTAGGVEPVPSLLTSELFDVYSDDLGRVSHQVKGVVVPEGDHKGQGGLLEILHEGVLFHSTSRRPDYSILYAVTCSDGSETVNSECSALPYYGGEIGDEIGDIGGCAASDELASALAAHKQSLRHKHCCVDVAPFMVCFLTPGPVCFRSDVEGNFGSRAFAKIQKIHTSSFRTLKRTLGGSAETETVTARLYGGCKTTQSLEKPSKAQGDLTGGQQSPKKIAFAFLVRSGLAHPEVWRLWFESAHRQSPATSDHNKKEHPLHEIFFHIGSGSASAQDLIPQAHVVPVVDNKWGDLNKATYYLLKAALDDKSVAAIILLSDTTIPVISFSKLYSTVEKLHFRTQFDLAHKPMPLLTPKHSQWLTLSRDHAQALVQNQEMWTCPSWMIMNLGDRAFGIAAPDEYLLLETLLHVYGHGTLQRQINDGQLRRWGDFNSFSPLPKESFVGGSPTHTHHTALWWTTKACSAYGKCRDQSGNGPAHFQHLYASKLEQLVKNPDVWFLRKVDREATVITDNEAHLPLAHFLAEHTDVL